MSGPKNTCPSCGVRLPALAHSIYCEYKEHAPECLSLRERLGFSYCFCPDFAACEKRTLGEAHLLFLACELRDDLVRMNAEEAIDLDQWPAAKALVEWLDL